MTVLFNDKQWFIWIQCTLLFEFHLQSLIRRFPVTLYIGLWGGLILFIPNAWYRQKHCQCKHQLAMAPVEGQYIDITTFYRALLLQSNVFFDIHKENGIMQQWQCYHILGQRNEGPKKWSFAHVYTAGEVPSMHGLSPPFFSLLHPDPWPSTDSSAPLVEVLL